jgi:hypothetical protein
MTQTIYHVPGIALLILLTAVHSGCHLPPLVDQELIETQTTAAEFKSSIIRTRHFDLMVKTRIRQPGNTIVIYIEGDGQAWLSEQRISSDPTPGNPLALKLALQDYRENVAYIARPCQYVMHEGRRRNCNNRYWTSHRFSEEVIQAMSEAVTRVKKESHARSVELVGYSGGGGLAALVAHRRTDVVLLRTVAGNLDHAAVNRHHGVSSLTGSLNPIDVALDLCGLCQVHYAGARDEVTPPLIARRFIEAQGSGQCNQELIVLEQANHWERWVEIWPSLLARPIFCSN